jgi:hypothetical protein
MLMFLDMSVEPVWGMGKADFKVFRWKNVATVTPGRCDNLTYQIIRPSSGIFVTVITGECDNLPGPISSLILSTFCMTE